MEGQSKEEKLPIFLFWVNALRLGIKGEKHVSEEHELNFECYELKGPLGHLDRDISSRHYTDMELRGGPSTDQC